MTQKGVAYRYNGKKPRTPLGGVYIKPVSASNGFVSKDSTGTFTLALNNLKMGSRIGNVQVTKQGMMVFNQQTVEEWSVRKDPLRLILCNADEFQRQKSNLIAIGESQARKKYDRKLAELKKQNDAKQLKIDEYYNKLDSLEKEYQSALKHMEEYADVFARIDESEVDTVAQHAIDMFNRGEIEESIRLLEQQDYMEKIIKSSKTIEQADKLMSNVEEVRKLAEEDKERAIEGVKTQIAGYKLQNELEKAKLLLKGLADNLKSIDAVWDYAEFCFNHHDIKEAELYFEEVKSIIEEIGCTDDETILSLLTKIEINLANIYFISHRRAESEEKYRSSLEIFKRLAAANPSEYESDIATTQNNMAVICRETMRYEESETLFKSALEHYRRLADSNPSVYEPHIAKTQISLAALYIETKRYEESEDLLRSSLRILDSLAYSNPTLYEPSLANALHNLAIFYVGRDLCSPAETMCKSALDIYRRLSESNPTLYNSEMASTQRTLGVIYRNTKRYAESEQLLKSSLEIYECLAAATPTVYESKLASTLKELAFVYSDTLRFAESEEKLKSALAIFERLAVSWPAEFETDVANTQICLALLYRTLNRYAECEMMYKSALTIFERYAIINPSVYEPDLVGCQNALAHLYAETQRYSESEAMNRKCIEIFSRLYEQEPLTYGDDLLNCHLWEGKYMFKLKKTDESKESFLKALNLAGQLNDISIYTHIDCLQYLRYISEFEKDYRSAYKYNKDCIEMVKPFSDGLDEQLRNEYFNILRIQSYYSNLLGKFSDGEKYSLEAMKVDTNRSVVYKDLAASLLFQGRFAESLQLYLKYKGKLKDRFLDDFAEFESLGVIPNERKKDVERIKALLNED